MYLIGEDDLFLNPTADVVRFRIPPPRLPVRMLIDSAAPEAPERDMEGEEVAVAARSAVLTVSMNKAV